MFLCGRGSRSACRRDHIGYKSLEQQAMVLEIVSESGREDNVVFGTVSDDLVHDIVHLVIS